ncbi:mannose-6-phosphate isomerase [Capsaspora owczarzaki ATCC 30864]|uniref:mannose-6-phosphate isomerase n=1 Tax=Capsaspora owczarzaki (strain ATCC 30864) TaxID=595528 RepID=UPI0001FE2561|nr:mannose-6-phosphate isomerase [Capsaspora owczarzaki ATCC 30864]|eukprot:XP_004364906.1 mannose-6-phosphate isomerase [Capsaspora owczarzaki ATCC 30864]
MSNPVSVVPVLGAVQNYAWGRLGSASNVAQLAFANAQSSPADRFAIDENAPYAELWMGTHPKAPLRFKSEAGNVVGPARPITDDARFATLPFLFKVLSIKKALSIQAHPTKDLARVLHARDPQNYPDDNHKPELAIALTDFVALCGFRPLERIRDAICSVPELASLVGGKDSAQALLDGPVDARRLALKRVFSCLMKADRDSVSKQLQLLVDRLQSQPNLNEDEDSKLILHVVQDFPGDVGCFVIYFLNVVHLKPGEGMFLAANEPHAYIKGDCIECMSSSDNVVRAGLTPKFMDVDVLLEMLTYESRLPAEQLLHPKKQPSLGFVATFQPPVQEFAVTRAVAETTGAQLELAAQPGPSLLIVTSGAAVVKSSGDQSVAYGSVLYIQPGTPLAMTSTSGRFEAYQAFSQA